VRALPAGLALVVLACSACGVGVDRHARPLDPDAAPYRIVTQDRSAPPTGAHRIVLYFVRDGALVPVARRISQRPTPAAVLKALSAGPSTSDQESGLTSGLPLGVDAKVDKSSGSIVTVSLPAPADSSTRTDSVLAFGQLVLTLTALPAVTGVLFSQDGKPLQVPRSDGSLSDTPLTRLDYRDLVDPS
jgi:spore germination protein GerM